MYLAVRFVSSENEESESFREFRSEFKSGFLFFSDIAEKRKMTDFVLWSSMICLTAVNG